MNYYFTGILIILLCRLAWMGPAYPGSTQTNTSGSNTAIEGGYTSTATTTSICKAIIEITIPINNSLSVSSGQRTEDLVVRPVISVGTSMSDGVLEQS